MATVTIVRTDSFLLFCFMFLLTRYALDSACARHIFFHPDFTVGFGTSPNQLSRADFTASRDFHSALKIQTFSRVQEKAQMPSFLIRSHLLYLSTLFL